MSSQLVDLPDVTRLSSRVTRVLGQNPNQKTLQGTNCYLIQAPGDARNLYLIDAGSGRPYSQSFAPLLIEQLKQLGGGHPATITDILITHRDEDHIGGLPDVLQALAAVGNQAPRIHKWTHTIEQHSKRDYDAELVDALPDGLYDRAEDGQALHLLKEGQTFVLASEKDLEKTTTLNIMHTPGHTNDSISLILEEENAIFTGDTVLGQGTTIFSNLTSYMASLNLYLAKSADILYPAHGPTIVGPAACCQIVTTYITHRQQREDQIVSILRSNKADGMTARMVVETVYEGMGEGTWALAIRPVGSHLRKLHGDGKVEKVGPVDEEVWKILE